VTRVGPAPRTDEGSLLRAYHEDGDLAARERLITDHLPLVRSLARRYARHGEQLDDLVQVGTIGLIRAIDRFDVDRGVALTTFAVPTIVGELKRHFRDRSWAVSVPRSLKELNIALVRFVDELTMTLGRSPTIAELAAASDADEESVIEALEVGRAYSSRSLSAIPDRDGGEAIALIDTLPDERRDAYEAVEERVLLAEGLRALDEREKRILDLRFFHGMTQSQIAVEVGISQMHVSRLIARALETLANEIEEP